MQALNVMKIAGFVIAGAWTSIASASQYEYVVSGSICTEYGPEIGSGRKPTDYDFRIQVADGKWSLKLVPRDAVASKTGWDTQRDYLPPDSLEASSDGTSFYFVVSTASQKAKNPGIVNSGEGFRGVGMVPYGACFDQIICLWYAYASGAYFHAVSNSNIHPLQSMPLDYSKEKPFLQPGEWVLAQEPPFLPSSILMRSVRPGTGTNGVPAQTFTNAVLNVSAFTNILGIALPAKVEISYYFWLPPVRPSLPRLRSHLTIQANQVSLEKNDNAAFVPALPLPSVVTDLRHLTSGVPTAVSVLATQWPTEREIAVAYHEKILLAQLETAKENTDLRKTIILRCLLAVIAGTPLIAAALWFWRRCCQRRTKTK